MRTLVQYQRTEIVSTIALDDSKANVMSVQMLQALNDALDRAQADGTVVLITGREGMFSAGFDLNVFKQGGAALFDMLKGGAQTVERLLSFPAPVVVACSGHAIAMGAFLLVAADVRIGVANGPFKISMNEVAIGLTVPHFALEACRHRLAPAVFDRAAITAETFAPEQAVSAGFLDYLVTAVELLPAAHEKAAALAALVRSAHTATKRRARERVLQALRRAIELDVADWSARFGP
jgi:enoyl-CoA hydratase/carnithine racemase